MKGRLYDRLTLAKPGISALSAAAAWLGYAACAPGRAGAACAASGVFLFSAGACALNNWQDRFYDGRLRRTRLRPLPSGRLAPGQALLQAWLLLGAGLAVLAACSVSAAGPLAGLGAVLLYNGAYTPLKKRTLLGLVPGVLCGTLPPLIGWAAAGGGPSVKALYLAVLFGVWQLPHLWLLALANSGDERAGTAPSFLDSLPEALLRGLVVAWASAFAFLTLFLKVFGLVGGLPALLLAANALALPAVFAAALYGPARAAAPRYLSGYLNLSLLGAALLAALF